MRNKLQLNIPETCHENWENMLPADKGKFCQSCCKQVVDFTTMSDTQLIAFFKKPATGSVCGRFMDDQLNRDIQLPRKTLPWVKYFFQVAIPAFLISVKADAQERPVKGKMVMNPVVKTIEMKNPSETIGEMILPVKSDTIHPMSELVGYAGAVTAHIEVSKIDTLFSNIVGAFNDSLEAIKCFNKKFTIYPNPAIKGQPISIENKKLSDDNYNIELINLSGQTVFSQLMNIGHRQKISMNVPPVSSGSYIIKLTGKQSRKAFAEKIIIVND